MAGLVAQLKGHIEKGQFRSAVAALNTASRRAPGLSPYYWAAKAIVCRSEMVGGCPQQTLQALLDGQGFQNASDSLSDVPTEGERVRTRFQPLEVERVQSAIQIIGGLSEWSASSVHEIVPTLFRAGSGFDLFMAAYGKHHGHQALAQSFQAYDSMANSVPDEIPIDEVYRKTQLTRRLDGLMKNLASSSDEPAKTALMKTLLVIGGMVEAYKILPGDGGPEVSYWMLAGLSLAVSARGVNLGIFHLDSRKFHLFDHRTGILFDPTTSPVPLSTLDCWRDYGLLGPSEGVAPLHSLLTSALITKGSNLLENGHHREARVLMEAALKTYEGPSSLAGELALLAAKLGKPDVAQSILKDAVRKNPMHAGNLHALGSVKRRGSAESIQYAQDALQSWQRVQALRLKATQKRNLYADASLLDGINSDEQYVPFVTNLILLHASVGNVQQTVQLLAEAHTFVQNHPEYLETFEDLLAITPDQKKPTIH